MVAKMKIPWIQVLLTPRAKNYLMADESIMASRLRRAPARAAVMPLLWAGGVLLCTALAWFVDPALSRPLLLGAAVTGCLPAILNLVLLPVLSEDWARALVVLAWTAMAGFAVAVSGSMASPFVVLFVLPVAAAHNLGGKGRLTIEAMVLSLFAIALVMVLDAGALLPPDQAGAPLMLLGGPFSVILTLLASASALALRRQGPLDAHLARLQLLRFARSAQLCMDARGRNLATTKTARRIIGGARRLGSVLGAGDRARFAAAMQRVLRSADDETLELDILPLQRDGEKAQHSRRYQAHLTREDQHALMVTLHDITEQAARVDKLIAERDAALAAAQENSLFLAGISHELRTPLNAIIGFSDMMKARLFGPLPAKYAEYADLIYDSGRHLVDLVGDVLDMSKIEAERYQLSKSGFDARDIVRSSVKLMSLGAEEAGVKLALNLPDTIVPVHADRKALRQILFNLISNAIKFTPTGGTVTVALSVQDRDLLITVKDNGVGMSAEDAARIGEPWQQAASAQQSSARGTGLGMALVKSLAQLHGGSMRVHSELGVGTSVCLRLPVINGSALGLGEVTRLDVRDHIRRAQIAGSEISREKRKIAGG